MTNEPDPKEALASIAAARQGMAADMDYPVGYGLAYGAVCGLLVAGMGLPQNVSVLVVPIALLALAASIHWWRKRYGWWVDGFSPKRARWVSVGMAAVLVALVFASLWGRENGVWWLSLVMGGVAFVTAIAAGHLWMRVWRAELKEQNQ